MPTTRRTAVQRSAAPLTPRVFDDGLFLPESPRWHDGCLWISDLVGRTLFRYDDLGRKQVVAVFEENPSGFGFAPDGSILVVSMRDRRVLRHRDGIITEHADLSHLEPTMLNDLAVAGDGTAYVTRFGWDPWKGEELQLVTVLRVAPDGRAEPIGPDLVVPNGVALSPDETTLYVAEAGGGKVWAIDLRSPAHPAEVFSTLPASPASDLGLATPDGVCVDGLGGLWVADPIGHRVVHLSAGGDIDHTVEFAAPDQPLAVALGGVDGTTLFVTVSQKTDVHAPATDPTGRVETVDVSGTGNRE